MIQAVEAYKSITATEEFKTLEMIREKTRRDEAQAIGNARRLGAEAERQKWQSVVAKRDTAIADQARIIAELRKLLDEK